MRENEFLFRFQKNKPLMNLQEFERVMNGRISGMIQRDLRHMDRRMVEVFDQKISTPKNETRGFIGKMPAGVALQKFR